jgi:DNA repair exonuclease SbcCD nuclease subunit
MSRLAIITDTHFGKSNDNKVILENIKNSLETVFFPYLDEHNIKRVIHMGDLFDRRTYINFNTHKVARECFLEQLEARGIETDIIVGNHDVSYRNTNEVNSLQELINGRYSNIRIHEDPTEIEVFGVKILLLPWINAENQEKTFELINKTNAKIVMGHLELAGFQMYRGIYADHGLDKNVFDKFHLVFSGHYHHRSISNSIHYNGAFSQHEWSDYDDDRGFVIFEPQNLQSEFIRNPLTLFKTISYNDEAVDYSTVNVDEYANCFVKLIVIHKSNPYMFDLFRDRLDAVGPANLTIIEEATVYTDNESELIDESQDTRSILVNYVDRLTVPVNPVKLKECVLELYTEAIAMETKI